MTTPAPPHSYPVKFSKIELTCTNTECRVLTYVGLQVHPLNVCPVCQEGGTRNE